MHSVFEILEYLIWNQPFGCFKPPTLLILQPNTGCAVANMLGYITQSYRGLQKNTWTKRKHSAELQ